jgi:N-acetylmuramoyl-L-alanine amidase
MRLVIAFILFISVQSDVFGEPFEGLQSRYLSLRNTDVDSKKVSEWRSLAVQFEAFVRNSPRATNAGQSLFNAGILYEELWRNHKNEADLTKSINLFESIPRDYPGDVFADDALVKVGDLWLQKDRKESKRRYREVVEAYPDGDMVDIAQKKLQELDGSKGKSKKRSESLSELPLVIVDPGHGGEDLGAKGVSGFSEKDIVLDVALKLENIVKAEKVYQVRLTRRSDLFVPLIERTEMANDYDASLFISLHVNSGPVRSVTGLETYYLDNTDDKSSQALAERENQFFEESGGASDINFILSDLIQGSKMEDSITLANVIHGALKQKLDGRWGKIKDHGVKRAPFYVLVGTHVPGALVEMLFINNPNDERLLSQSGVRQNLAEGVNQGIKDFLSRKEKSK